MCSLVCCLQTECEFRDAGGLWREWRCVCFVFFLTRGDFELSLLCFAYRKRSERLFYLTNEGVKTAIA